MVYQKGTLNGFPILEDDAAVGTPVTNVSGDGGDLLCELMSLIATTPPLQDVVAVIPDSTSVEDETEAFRTAITTAGAGGTLWLIPGRTYKIDRTLTLLANQTILGNRATIKRADAAASAATGTASTGGNSIVVTDGSVFRVGQTINVTDISDPNGGVGYDENQGSTPLTIASIVTNTITISETWARDIAVGDVVFARHELFHRIGASRDEVITFRDLFFDGNKANSGQTSDWRLNRCVNVSTARSVFENCHFKDMPSENLVIDRGWVHRCSFGDLEGSFVHVSSVRTVEDDEVFVISECHGDGCNIATNAIMFHSQGMVTLSNDARIMIRDCRFKNGSEHIVADGSLDSGYLEITNSQFNTFGGILNHSSATTDDRTKRIVITDNDFVDCGDLTIYGRAIKTAFPCDQVVIRNNYFLNSRFYFDEVAGLRFNYNRCLSDAGYASAVTAANAFIGLWTCDDCIVTNNVFQGPQTFDDEVRHCFYLRSDSNLKDSVGTNTGYRYSGNIHINNNTITRFRNAIAIGDTTPGTYSARQLEWRACTFNDNTIYTIIETIGASHCIPVVADPGWEVARNTIHIQSVGANVVPIQCHGLDETGASVDATTHIGAHVHHNRIEAPTTMSHSIRIGKSALVNDYNAYVHDNQVPVAVAFDTAGATSNSVEENNVLLFGAGAKLTNVTARTVPPANWSEEYSNQY